MIVSKSGATRTHDRLSLKRARQPSSWLRTRRRRYHGKCKWRWSGQIVTAYARPFTKSQITASKRIIPLAEEIVPVAFQDLHSEHLEMRDRAIGHKDAVGFPTTALNRVIVHVNGTGFELHTVSPDSITDFALRRTIELCQHLVAHCEAEVLKYASHFFGVGAGDYFLNIEESPTEWLKRNN